MALRWDFKKDKIGWLEDNQETRNYAINLYSGNALMIAVYESDKNYWMHSFLCDEEHAKNCLEDFMIYEKHFVFHLFRHKKHNNKLARILTKYHHSIIWEDETDENENK